MTPLSFASTSTNPPTIAVQWEFLELRGPSTEGLETARPDVLRNAHSDPDEAIA